MGRIAGLSAAETRARLLEAAVAVFAERGFEGARTSEIARRAGLSTGAIYSQFGTKAELLQEAIESCAPAELNRLFAGEVGESETVTGLVEVIGAGLPYKPRAVVTLLMEALAASQRQPEVGELVAGTAREREALVTSIIRAAQAAGDIDPALPPAALARFAVTLVFGSLVIQGLGLDPPDVEDWSAVIRRLVGSIRRDQIDQGG